MKFTRIDIEDYGPLQGWSLQEPGNFNLLFGRNEAGKTLAIEAIWKMLWSKHAQKLEGADRVEERPRGFLRLEIENGNIRFPDSGNLGEKTDLTPELCRDTFIVRNSDLNIKREGDYFSDVTSRLTGLKSAEIEKIKKEIRNLAYLTDTLKIKNDASSDKLKDRLDTAQRLTGEIEDLLQKIEGKGWDKLEHDLVLNIEKAEMLKNELDELQLARKREMYEEGKKTYEELKEVKNKVQALQGFTEEDATHWRDLARERENIIEDLQKLERNEKDLEGKLKKADEKLEEIDSAIKRLQRAKTTIDNDVTPDLREMERREEAYNKVRTGEGLFRITGIISLLLLAASLLTGIIFPGLAMVSLLIGGGGLALGFFSWYRILALRKEEGQIAAILARMKNKLQPFSIEGEDREEIVVAMEKFQQEYQGLENRKAKLNTEKTYALRRQEDLVRDKKNLHERIKEIGEEIEDLTNRSKTEELDEYQEKLTRRKELEDDKTRLIYRLQSIFQVEEKSIDWEEEINKYREFSNKATEWKFSREDVQKKEQELEDLKERRRAKEEELETFRKDLAEIERVVNNEVFRGEDHIPCGTSLDLKEVGKKLQEFIDHHEENMEKAEIVLEVFSEIKEEEEEKVAGIFADSRAGDIFSRITMGKYLGVHYNREIGRIMVREEGGKNLPAEKLSGGTFDQLYLAIRVAMGEKILGEKPGFFILDDPFIKADQERLECLLNTVLELARQGWQILYFTCKNEVRESLSDAINEGKVKVTEIG